MMRKFTNQIEFNTASYLIPDNGDKLKGCFTKNAIRRALDVMKYQLEEAYAKEGWDVNINYDVEKWWDCNEKVLPVVNTYLPGCQDSYVAVNYPKGRGSFSSLKMEFTVKIKSM